jgi:DNA primase
MSNDWVDFTEIKAEVTMEMVVSHYGIELRRVNASNLRGDCPLPSHSADGTKNSFAVNTEKNAWACQSASCVAAREGRKGGNVLDFVTEMEGCTVRDAALKIQDWFSVTASNERPSDYVPSRDTAEKEDPDTRDNTDKKSVRESTDRGEVNQPLEFALKSVDYKHPYIKKRGIKEETAKHFGIGFFHGRGSMSERLVIPIYNPDGDLVAYAGRAIDDEVEPKYKLPAGFRKSLELFNLQNCRLLAN